MLLEKKKLSFEEIEAQSALELPDRELLALVRITNVLNGLHIDVDVGDVNVAVQVCAIVGLITANLLTVDKLKCQIIQ